MWEELHGSTPSKRIIVERTGLDPLNADSDNDMVNDFLEKDPSLFHSAPWCQDSDGDGVVDGVECRYGGDLNKWTIYVEVDWMMRSSVIDGPHRLGESVRNLLISKFNMHGIELIIDDGETGLGGGNEINHIEKLFWDTSAKSIYFFRNGEDLDYDGHFDTVREDLDSDKRFSVDEDLDKDGGFDTYDGTTERDYKIDSNHNEILDTKDVQLTTPDGDKRNEDSDYDTYLDKTETDIDGDGHLDSNNEDINKDGRMNKPQFTPDRVGIFHYCILAHYDYEDTVWDSIHGRGETYGYTFAGYDSTNWLRGDKVSAFMHELGHNIGLYDSDDWSEMGGNENGELDGTEDDDAADGGLEDYCESGICAMNNEGSHTDYCNLHWKYITPSCSFN